MRIWPHLLLLVCLSVLCWINLQAHHNVCVCIVYISLSIVFDSVAIVSGHHTHTHTHLTHECARVSRQSFWFFVFGGGEWLDEHILVSVCIDYCVGWVYWCDHALHQLYSRKRLRLVSHVARLLSGLCARAHFGRTFQKSIIADRYIDSFGPKHVRRTHIHTSTSTPTKLPCHTLYVVKLSGIHTFNITCCSCNHTHPMRMERNTQLF